MFSATVRCGNKAYCWKTKPRFRLCDGMFVTSAPEISTLPVEGSSKPAMIFKIVVLPEPLGPSSVTSAPSETENEVGSTAVTVPNSLETWSTTTASAASCSEPTIRDLLAGPPRQFGSALPFRIKRAQPQVKHVVCF